MHFIDCNENAAEVLGLIWIGAVQPSGYIIIIIIIFSLDRNKHLISVQ